MNGFWLLLPFLAVRFGLLLIMRKGAIQRAGYFAPVQGTEKNSLLYLPSIKYRIVFISACNSSKNRLFIILLFALLVCLY